MHCRWGKSHSLLIEGGLTFDAIKQSVATASIAFREGVVELFELLEVELFLPEMKTSLATPLCGGKYQYSVFYFWFRVMADFLYQIQN